MLCINKHDVTHVQAHMWERILSTESAATNIELNYDVIMREWYIYAVGVIMGQGCASITLHRSAAVEKVTTRCSQSAMNGTVYLLPVCSDKILNQSR